ncbi:hypothetical protein E1B28_011949 [Marasmius oreades]|uniref:Uncharacterized protein n=1 Tax=Marasmius oreades TaxID=181124 RepID=A0A9P7UMP9_9AGAR|nr:uncharacterized protein E1B28_011949 [Marasmius oreades]KAG7087902.1 hypothetical protein E1B28_011949 [Marasmius oreades]
MKAGKILSSHHAIRHSRGNPFYGLDMTLLEDLLDSAQSLTFPPPDRGIQQGTWVSLKHPSFARDLALMVAVLLEDNLHVLLTARPTKMLMRLGV